MAGEIRRRRNSSTQLLDELETLSQSLSTPTSTARARRANSLALARDGGRANSLALARDGDEDGDVINPTLSSTAGPTGKPRPRRLSMSPWRSRPKLDHHHEDVLNNHTASAEKRGGVWNWKPIRAISHIGMHKLSCLFSIDVVAVHGLPASMNGLRLSVCVRKRETKDGAVQTMPSRVLQGAADFEETLFLRCHVYSTGSGNHLKFEPRPFLIYVSAIDAQELDFGKHSVDLSFLLQESITKSSQGSRIRQWDTSYALYGKAKGGELVLKLGFQIMDRDGGQGIYAKAGLLKPANSPDSLSSFARRQSKSSFSVPSQRMTSRTQASTPSKAWSRRTDSHHFDDLNLDEPEPKTEDLDFPEFVVVDKGVETEDKTNGYEGGDLKHATDGTSVRSVSSEVVKEVVPNQVHLTRLTELDSIAQQIKALESMVDDDDNKSAETDETDSERLDADEENVTIEFLQMLEEKESNKKKLNHHDDVSSVKSEETESMVFVQDLGKGLGSVVQTKNGGYLAAVNPFNMEISRNETPKLAIQLSKPLILPQNSESGIEMFRRVSAVGIEELSSQVSHLMPIDELMGKTAEQIAFEGIASAIIHGRNKSEGASSSAARTIEAVKTMAKALSFARKERISTGIWNVQEEPAILSEILVLAIQKIEAMVTEALKIQADIAEDVAPFDVSPLVDHEKEPNRPLTAGVPLEDWLRKEPVTVKEEGPTVSLSVVVQLRDPVRRYEAVGGPLLVLIQATSTPAGKDNDEVKFKLASLHVGGFKVWTRGSHHVWDAETQRLTAMQWLVGNGFAKAGKKAKNLHAKGPDTLWSISSRVVADMWLKSIRNPDIKFPKQ